MLDEKGGGGATIRLATRKGKTKDGEEYQESSARSCLNRRAAKLTGMNAA